MVGLRWRTRTSLSGAGLCHVHDANDSGSGPQPCRHNSTMHGEQSSSRCLLKKWIFTLFVGLVSYDGDDSQSDSETANDRKARITAPLDDDDNVRVTISGLVVAVSLWLAVPPFASGFRAKVRP